ncbi:MAG: Hpt domain-containing protein [Gemmatimonadaceae bacterium]|nr:Hpt domain-containing protein [Gemmatimonadaceae bacterium]MCW5827376.1 Hpt domain-containing protein [Gemmatimonadaceae bacterium]
MTGGLLDFFTLEASEYVEQLDGLVSRATAAPPDGESFVRAVRALRGSATMAKVTGIANLAQALERLARQVGAGQLAWDAASRGVAISAIDDTKILIRGVRNWSAAEDARVAQRVAELDQIAPPTAAAAPAAVAPDFLAGATADAAAALLEYAETPGAREHFDRVMDKVRALRGVAALNDLPPLGEVVDAVDAAAKPIELGREDATAERRRLFRTAARVLLEGGDAVRQGHAPPTDSPALQEFTLAAAALSGGSADGDDVVPIAALLMDSPDAVQAAGNPPTTAAQRFRLEVVSQAEHLRRLVHEGRRAADAATRERLGREMRNAVRNLARAAQSFAAVEIANCFLAAERGAAALEQPALDVLERAAMLLSAANAAPETMAAQFVDLSEMLSRGVTPLRSATPPSSAATFASLGPSTGGAPSGAALKSLLSQGLSGLSPLGTATFAEPVVGEEDDVIPIEDLLFRGKDALARAIELGDALRSSGNTPDAATLAELYDLLQLAAAE